MLIGAIRIFFYFLWSICLLIYFYLFNIQMINFGVIHVKLIFRVILFDVEDVNCFIIFTCNHISANNTFILRNKSYFIKIKPGRVFLLRNHSHYFFPGFNSSLTNNNFYILHLLLSKPQNFHLDPCNALEAEFLPGMFIKLATN